VPVEANKKQEDLSKMRSGQDGRTKWEFSKCWVELNGPENRTALDKRSYGKKEKAVKSLIQNQKGGKSQLAK